MTEESILIEGARQNNLKGLTLRLPLNRMIVVTGVSGSGKSSLAFDTVYSEGQRRYVETFSPYTRQFLDRMDRPRVDRIEGIPPAIAIDQTNPVRTSRSTVGTMTELNDHLKLLYARAARLHCRGCGRPVQRDTPDSIWERLLPRSEGDGEARQPQRALITFPVRIPHNFSEEEVQGLLARQGYRRIHRREGNLLEVVQDRVEVAPGNRARIVEDLEAALKHGQGRLSVIPLDGERSPLSPLRFSADLHCPDCDLHYQDPQPNLFSFNSPMGACESCRGFGRVIGIDYDLVIPDPELSLEGGAIRTWQSESYAECRRDLRRFARRRAIPLDVPWRELGEEQRRLVLQGEGEWYGVKGFFDWLESKSYKMHIRVLLSRYRTYRTCPACGGARLRPEALLWRLGGDGHGGGTGESGLNIHQLMLQPIERSREMFEGLSLPAPLDEAAELLLGEIRTRLRYLTDVGLGYLTLDRQSRTLSGGEVQRINLTTALGTSLVNTLFVLDEPSIGLHPRDIGRLIRVLHRLRDAGNTILVVEHDPQVIRAADLVLDMGPGAGERGGEVVFNGRLEELLRSEHSLTAQYLSGRRSVLDADVDADVLDAEVPGGRSVTPGPAPGETPGGAAQALRILGAAQHNLKQIDVDLPLRRLVCVTGVSGSGKSTLIQDVLYPGLLRLRRRPTESPGKHRAILGHESIAAVEFVDQSPIGKTTRSNPACYVGAFDPIRKLFAAEPLSRERGYTAGTFSFNSGKGRCPSCGGNGFEHVEMQFLSDVYLRCPDCDGRRYRPDVLEVRLLPARAPGAGADGRLEARSIADVLEMTVSEACDFFSGDPEVGRALEPLRAVGLEYLRLGQPVPTLSGGEAQRLKLAWHLARAGGGAGAARAARCSCSTSRPPACTSTTSPGCCAPSGGCWRPGTRSWSSSTTWTSSPPPTGSWTWARKGGRRAAGWSAPAPRPKCGPARTATPAGRCRPTRRRAPRAAKRPPGAAAERSEATASTEGAPAADGAAANGADGLGRHRHPPRPGAQPAHRRPAHPAGGLHRHHRGERQRQEHAGLRHPLRRGAAPLSGVAERLRPPDRPARVPGRRGRGVRHPPHRGDRAAHQPRRPQEHGGHGDRDLPLPAPAVRPAGHPALPRLRHPHRAPVPGGHPGPAAAGEAGAAGPPAGPPGQRPQGLLHRPGPLGRPQGVRQAAGGRRSCCPPRPGRAWTASASTPSSCRWARSW